MTDDDVLKTGLLGLYWKKTEREEMGIKVSSSSNSSSQNRNENSLNYLHNKPLDK